MARRDIVVMGASAGGIQAARDLLARLPADLRASLFIVIHIPAERPTTLTELFGRVSRLLVRHPAHLDPIRPGVIYVAPPNSHLVLAEHGILLGQGPRENGHRPAIDPLFRTAAKTFGKRVIGVILSGTLDDGTAGLHWVHQSGGITIVQHPSEAAFPDMPANAIRGTTVDHVVSVAEMADLLPRLVREEVPREVSEMKEDKDGNQPDKAVGNDRPRGRAERLAEKNAVYTCPDCSGPLWEIDLGDNLVRYECRVGHAYSAETLLESQAEGLEAAFWMVLRNLEENVSFLRRLLGRSVELGHRLAAAHYEEQIRMAEGRIAIVRHALFGKEFTWTRGPAAEVETPLETAGEPPEAQ